MFRTGVMSAASPLGRDTAHYNGEVRIQSDYNQWRCLPVTIWQFSCSTPIGGKYSCRRPTLSNPSCSRHARAYPSALPVMNRNIFKTFCCSKEDKMKINLHRSAMTTIEFRPLVRMTRIYSSACPLSCVERKVKRTKHWTNAGDNVPGTPFLRASWWYLKPLTLSCWM